MTARRSDVIAHRSQQMVPRERAKEQKILSSAREQRATGSRTGINKQTNKHGDQAQAETWRQIARRKQASALESWRMKIALAKWSYVLVLSQQIILGIGTCGFKNENLNTADKQTRSVSMNTVLWRPYNVSMTQFTQRTILPSSFHPSWQAGRRCFTSPRRSKLIWRPNGCTISARLLWQPTSLRFEPVEKISSVQTITVATPFFFCRRRCNTCTFNSY